ncbi:MAG: prepilin peptidase [Planctomycetota bacterium]|nr:prepilin peptidase [Planctomycetota bacterium]
MIQRRVRRNWPYLIVCGLTALVAAVYMIVPAYLAYRNESLAIGAHARLVAMATFRDRAMELLAGGFLFWLGACIGSFLNVVIYRVPQRQTILGHSMCPYCRHRIHAIDNVPIFAWLRLRGRCRNCRLPIAARYMWVELTVALMFLLLGIVELGTGGANLPHVQPPHSMEFAWVVLVPDWRLGLVYLAHASLLSTLVVVTLIQLDGRRTPTSIWWPAVCFVLAAHCVSPAMHPVRWNEVVTQNQRANQQFDPRLEAPQVSGGHVYFRLVDGVLGSLGGATVAILIGLGRRAVEHRGLKVQISAATGWAIGWQGVVSVWLLASIWRILTAFGAPARWRKSGALWVATWTCAVFVHLLVWRLVHVELWQVVPTQLLVCAILAMIWILECVLESGEPGTAVTSVVEKQVDMAGGASIKIFGSSDESVGKTGQIDCVRAT